MPYQHVLFRSEAREKVLRGATAIADAVRVTLGPRSRSVLIEKKWGKRRVGGRCAATDRSHDGRGGGAEDRAYSAQP